jgi:hypothetical protein
MLALWQSALVRGWMAVSAAKTGKAAIRAIPKAKIEAINFMACSPISSAVGP